MSAVVWSQQAHDEARQHQQCLTKPPGSLGRLEDLACWLAGCQRRSIPTALKPAITLFAADHGVAAERLIPLPQVVTVEMVRNFVDGGAAINQLAKEHQASLQVVDVGVAGDLTALGDAVVHAKVGPATANMMHGPAMSVDEMAQAMLVGRKQADCAIADGANLLIAGEMGIANTTVAAALACGLLAVDADQIVGHGTGVDDQGVQRKIAVVQRTLQRVGSDPSPEALLQQCGGFEIAAICGFLLQGAYRGVPALLDGFIVTAAALVAERIEPGCCQWWQASHCSQEKGHRQMLAALNLEPLLQLGLRLGEGSGAAVALPLLRSAIALHAGMATFSSAGVSTEGG